MTQAVTFDCWNTLLIDDDARDEKMKAYFLDVFCQYECSLNLDDMEDMLRDEQVLYENHILSDRKTLDARGRAESFLSIAGFTLPEDKIAEVSDYCNRLALEIRPPLVPKAKEVVKELAESYKLGLICNTGWHSGEVLREILEGYELLSFFDCTSFSDEVGVAKPHPKIFETTVGKMGCRLEDTVHVGDSEAADIEGARKIGMHAILFTGVTKSEEELTRAYAVINELTELPKVLKDMPQ